MKNHDPHCISRCRPLNTFQLRGLTYSIDSYESLVPSFLLFPPNTVCFAFLSSLSITLLSLSPLDVPLLTCSKSCLTLSRCPSYFRCTRSSPSFLLGPLTSILLLDHPPSYFSPFPFFFFCIKGDPWFDTFNLVRCGRPLCPLLL